MWISGREALAVLEFMSLVACSPSVQLIISMGEIMARTLPSRQKTRLNPSGGSGRWYGF
jgi:hypothetical protein